MKWVETIHCRSGAHCQACVHDPKFRQESPFQFPEVCPFAQEPPNPHDGPGTRLARLLKKCGFRYHPKCGCLNMVLSMNLWAERCEQHVEEILSVMRESAKDPLSNPLRLPFSEYWARALVLHCLRDRSG